MNGFALVFLLVRIAKFSSIIDLREGLKKIKILY